MSDAAPRPRKKSFAWAWFLVLLVIASIAAAAFMIRYNLARQLKPEQLEAAWASWKTHGPRSYRMTYTQEVNGQKKETFQARVRDGTVEEVLHDGRPLEREQLAHYSMDRLFAHVEKFLFLDRQPGQPKTFTVAVFDDTTGALKYYVRRVMGTQQRVEIQVKLEDLPP